VQLPRGARRSVGPGRLAQPSVGFDMSNVVEEFIRKAKQ
jgi:hypothetical protein